MENHSYTYALLDCAAHDHAFRELTKQFTNISRRSLFDGTPEARLVTSSSETQAQANAAARGKMNDQGGHVVAHRFVLDQGKINIFPQEGNFNMLAFKTLENDHARFTAQGHAVNFTHTLADFDKTGQPGSVQVNYNVVD